MAVQTARAWRATIPFLDASSRRYGPVFTMRAMPWGTAVVVNDTDLVKQVFSGDPAVYHAGEGNGILAPVVGSRSVLVLDEDDHLEARRTLLPPFHGEAVRAYGQVVEEIVAEEVNRWPLLEAFPLHPRFRAITLEVILRAVIGVTDPQRLRALRGVLPECLQISPTIMAMWAIPGLARVGPWRRFRARLAEANGLLREEIRDRRRDPNLQEREDVLSRLIAGGADEDDDWLRDQIMTLLVAGHETSSTGLAWTFERLLRHPTILARAREGEDAYLDAVLQESLRVRPVLPVVLRQLRAPVALGGYELPKGITVMPAITLMHENPALFSEPHRFRPERFLEGDEGGTYAWIRVRRRAQALPGCGLRELRDAGRAQDDPAVHRAAGRRSRGRAGPQPPHHARPGPGRPRGAIGLAGAAAVAGSPAAHRPRPPGAARRRRRRRQGRRRQRSHRPRRIAFTPSPATWYPAMSVTAPNICAGGFGAVYDFYIERPRLMGLIGRAVWGMDASLLYRSIAQLGSAEHVTIVDVPCGGGVAFRALRPGQEVRYIAADVSPKMIGRAERRARKRSLGQVEFAVADMTRLPLEPGEADLVACFSGLHMLTDPGEALNEFARCLRPGGLLTGTTFLLDDLSRRARTLFELGARRGHAMPPARDELTAALAEAGFCDAAIGPPAGFAAFSARRGDA